MHRDLAELCQGPEVADDEYLYRRVPRRRSHLRETEGELRPTSAAFEDSEQQISVDLASLRKDPRELCNYEGDGVLMLECGKVKRDVKCKDGSAFCGVWADPVDGNEAHALICVRPTKASTGSFKQIKTALVLIASWKIIPAPLDDIV